MIRRLIVLPAQHPVPHVAENEASVRESVYPMAEDEASVVLMAEEEASVMPPAEVAVVEAVGVAVPAALGHGETFLLS